MAMTEDENSQWLQWERKAVMGQLTLALRGLVFIYNHDRDDYDGAQKAVLEKLGLTEESSWLNAEHHHREIRFFLGREPEGHELDDIRGPIYPPNESDKEKHG